MKTRIIIMGPPASGKGTQAALLKAHHDLPTMSTGAVLRREQKEGSELGRLATELLDKGQFFPDELILQLVAKWLEEHSAKFVFDGFPRTVAQARGLDDLLAQRNLPLQVVFYLDVPKSVLAERVLGRVQCQDCGAIYQLGHDVAEITAPCAQCGGSLAVRPDDNLDVLQERLAQFEEKTLPVVDYYAQRSLVHTLSGDRAPEDIFSEIQRQLDTAASHA